MPLGQQSEQTAQKEKSLPTAELLLAQQTAQEHEMSHDQQNVLPAAKKKNLQFEQKLLEEKNLPPAARDDWRQGNQVLEGQTEQSSTARILAASTFCAAELLRNTLPSVGPRMGKRANARLHAARTSHHPKRLRDPNDVRP